jgi:hypothetical protein
MREFWLQSRVAVQALATPGLDRDIAVIAHDRLHPFYGLWL